MAKIARINELGPVLCRALLFVSLIRKTKSFLFDFQFYFSEWHITNGHLLCFAKCWWGLSCWIFGGAGGLTRCFAEVFEKERCKREQNKADYGGNNVRIAGTSVRKEVGNIERCQDCIFR